MGAQSLLGPLRALVSLQDASLKLSFAMRQPKLQSFTHTHRHTQIHTDTHIHRYTDTQTHTQTHIDTQYTDTYTQRDTHSHTHIHTDTHRHRHTHTQAHMHADTHGHTQTHTDTATPLGHRTGDRRLQVLFRYTRSSRLSGRRPTLCFMNSFETEQRALQAVLCTLLNY